MPMKADPDYEICTDDGKDNLINLNKSNSESKT